MDLQQQYGAIEVRKATNLSKIFAASDNFVDSASAIISIALSGRCHHLHTQGERTP